jgi:hypothetical protein
MHKRRHIFGAFFFLVLLFIALILAAVITNAPMPTTNSFETSLEPDRAIEQ